MYQIIVTFHCQDPRSISIACVGAADSIEKSRNGVVYLHLLRHANLIGMFARATHGLHLEASTHISQPCMVFNATYHPQNPHQVYYIDRTRKQEASN